MTKKEKNPLVKNEAKIGPKHFKKKPNKQNFFTKENVRNYPIK